MAIETGLEGKPLYIPVLVAVGLAGVLVFCGHYFVFKGMNQEIAAKNRQLEGLERQINEGLAAQRSLPQFREEVARLELELGRLLRILPSSRNTQDLLRRLRALTEQGDFTLHRFTPKNETRRDFYSEWPIQIRLEGSYHNLALLFDKVRRFARIINVQNLRVTALRRSDGPHTINAQFDIQTFLYNDDQAAGGGA